MEVLIWELKSTKQPLISPSFSYDAADTMYSCLHYSRLNSDHLQIKTVSLIVIVRPLWRSGDDGSGEAKVGF